MFQFKLPNICYNNDIIDAKVVFQGGTFLKSLGFHQLVAYEHTQFKVCVATV